MRKVILTSLIVMMVAVTSFAAAPGIGDGIVDIDKFTGQHFNLNIIGVQNPKKANMDDNGGGVIFVDLNGKSKIELVNSDDPDVLAAYPNLDEGEFKVLDKNATDRSPGVLALPDPGLDPYIVPDEDGEEIWPEGADTITNYSIFARALGSPQGNPYAKITTCATVLESALLEWLDKDAINILNDLADDPDQFGGVCSIESTGQLMREKGQSIFTNQTAALLTIVLKVEVYEWQDTDLDPTTPDVLVLVDTIYVRIPIFNDMLEGEYWEYDNNGLKLLQLRIYRVGTDVTTADDPTAWDLLDLP
jgi:hypothetical protein